MVYDATRRDASTRRAFLAAAAVTGGAAIAGCFGDSARQEGTTNDDEAGTTTTVSTADHESYAVTMAPVGEVTFQSVPDRWVPYCGGYADMGVALGQADGMAGIGGFDRYYTGFYKELPGVSVPAERLQANGLNDGDMDKELLYGMDAGVHVIDPEMLIHWFDWTQGDVDEIASNVAPFLGSLIFRRTDDWHDYRYYSMYEAFETLATLFREEERFRAFRELHDEFVAEVTDRLPPEDERPEVFLTFEGTEEPTTFSPYRLDDRGTNKKQWRDLGARDALAETDIPGLSTDDRGELDYETLLELDPEVILIRGHREKSATEFRETVLAYMRDHPAGSDLQAVQEGRVYRGGLLHEGPIQNLFLTERGAKQLYPEEFGEVTSDAQLFDRDRLASIVTEGPSDA